MDRYSVIVMNGNAFVVDADFLSKNHEEFVVFSVNSRQLRLISRELSFRITADPSVVAVAVNDYLNWKSNPNNSVRIDFIRSFCSQEIGPVLASVHGKLRIPGVDDYYRSFHLGSSDSFSVQELCSVIGSDAAQIAMRLQLAYYTFGTIGFIVKNSYEMISIPKKNSTHSRKLHIPSEWLKLVQRHILKVIDQNAIHANCSHGFIKGRSIITGAAPHTCKKVVLRLDIERAFENTHTTQVREIISKIFPHFLKVNVDIITMLTTYCGFLPTGAPTSPILLNLSLNKFDTAIMEYSESIGVTYTRYADDLTFSGDFDVTHMVYRVSCLLSASGYRLNHKKIKVMRQSDCQMVTGIVVNDKLNAPRKYRRKLRAALHSLTISNSAFWNGKEAFWGTLKGCSSFVTGINPEISKFSNELYWISILQKRAVNTRDATADQVPAMLINSRIKQDVPNEGNYLYGFLECYYR